MAVGKDHEYSLLTNDDAPPPSYNATPNHVIDTAFVNHNYDEPYIEPASQEEELMLQLRRMAIPIIAEENLKYVLLGWILISKQYLGGRGEGNLTLDVSNYRMTS